MKTYQEKLDVVDENDNIIGQETRENIHKKGLLHREVHIWLYNDKGEVVLQLRSKNAETFPGLLDISVGGHVELGQSYLDAALMELEEETGIKVKEDDLIFLKKIHRSIHDKSTGLINRVFQGTYAYRYNGGLNGLISEEAASFELWPIGKIFKLTDKEKKKFIPLLAEKEMLGILGEIKDKLVKPNKV